MFFFNISSQNVANKINKISSSILTAPVKGYSGQCPFLRSLGSISTSAQPDAEDHSFDANRIHLNSCYETASISKINIKEQEQQDHNELDSCELIGNDTIDNENDTEQECNKYDNNHSQIGIKAFRRSPIDKKKNNYDYNSILKSLIQKKKDDDSYRIFRKVKRFSTNFPYGTEQGRPVLIWCSNDYFGLSSHPKVHEAIKKGLREFGAGSGGTRNIAGNSPIHERLEWELADLHQKEAALLFSSCFVANDSTLMTLLRLIPDCEIFSDAGNHASMIQGIRNSGARKHIFRAFDPVDLEEKLRLIPISTPKIVAFETVHSMTGEISDVGRMCDIAHEYGAMTFVDEVHAVGLYGENGAGIGQRDGCMEKIDIVSGTLGKAYGNCGGYIASSSELIDVVRSYAPGFIFTTSLPPTVVLGATESVRILKGEEGKYLRNLQQNNVAYMKKALMCANLSHYPSRSHIVPIPVGDAAKCTQVSSDLLDVGHYIQSINYPTVPKGTERLRVSITPFHSEQMIDSLVEEMIPVWQRHKLSFTERKLSLRTGSFNCRKVY